MKPLWHDEDDDLAPVLIEALDTLDAERELRMHCANELALFLRRLRELLEEGRHCEALSLVEAELTVPSVH